MKNDLSSYSLVHWAYHEADEVLLIYSNSFSVLPIIISRKDFDRAFGNIVSLNLLQLLQDYSYRFVGSFYCNV